MDALDKLHYKLAMLVTIIAAAALYYLAPAQEQQIVILLIFAGLIGVPHGLTDWWLLTKASKRMGFSGSIGKLRIIGALIYIMLMAAFLLFWLLLPVAALGIFLCLSIWHFGMQDALAHHISGKQKIFHGLLRGVSLIAIIYLSHGQTAEYFNLLTNPSTFSEINISQNAVMWLAGFYVFTSVFSKKIGYVLESALLMVVCIALPPLLAFTLYFCLWHTPRHYLQVWMLSGNSMDNNHKIFYISVFTVALVAIVCYVITMAPLEPSVIYIALFFKLLGALTFSHVVYNKIAE